MKPPDTKCISQWKRGRVTDVYSANNINVDGIPCHVLDVKRVIFPSESSEDLDGEGEMEADAIPHHVSDVRREIIPSESGEEKMENRR